MIPTDARVKIPDTPEEPTAERVAFPVSFAQERMWFLDQLEPGTPTYNISHRYRLSGTLDVRALEASIRDLVRRHETLRTVFDVMDGIPLQVIHAAPDIRLTYIDLTPMPQGEREAHAQQQATAEARCPFDLKTGPLLRTTLYRLEPDRHILHVVIHHIISDGWSMTVLNRDLAAFYTAHLRGVPPALAELPLQYADYAVWQREWLRGQILEQQVAYWKKQLAGAPSLELPTDFARPPLLTHTGDAIQLTLPEDLADRLQALSRRQGATLFMTLFAAFQILLSRATGQTDLVVGTPVAARTRREIEGLIGVFLNTLVLRTTLDGDRTFRELLARVRATALDAYSHQDLPFEKLLEELKPSRDPSRTPLFQVFFNMHIFDQQEWSLPGIEVERLPSLQHESNFDLTLYVNRVGRATVLDLIYNTNLFAPEWMQEFLDEYVHLLSQIVTRPEDPISKYSLVTPQARRILPDPTIALSDGWRGPIHTRLSENAALAPDQIAIAAANEVWSYRELDERTNQLANYLIAKGTGKGDIVAIYAHRSAALVWAILGVLKAGAATLILDPAYPAARLITYLEIAGPRGWVQLQAAGALDVELSEYVAAQKFSCRLNLPPRALSRHCEVWEYSSAPPVVTVGPDDIACITFTSGSSGQPKGVLGRHGPLTHFIPWQQATFGLNASYRFSMLSGLSHDPLQRDIFTPLWLGAMICIPAPDVLATPGAVAQWMAQEDITFAHLTPAMAQLMAEPDRHHVKLSALRYASFVGDKLTRHDVESVRQLAPQVTCLNSYGSTETQRAVAYYIIPNESEKRPHKAVYPVGRGLFDVQLLILTETRERAGIGELGEIYVRSPHLASAYLGDAELTRARFVENPWTHAAGDRLYRTGDLGRYLPDGNVEFLGRADRQLKLRGFRIEPGEIEGFLLQHPTVREAVVTLYEDERIGPVLVAYVVAADKVQPASQKLRAFVRERLPDHMVPAEYIFLPHVPITPNGKIDFDALPKPPPREQPHPTDMGLDTELERKLAGIWEQVLKVQKIGRRDDFFELGGHSLLAIRLFAQIERELGKKLPIAVLFRAPTVAELARTILEQGDGRANQILVPIQPGGSKRPFFCVHGLGGGVIGYAQLAKQLGSDQPFYGLQARGLDDVDEPDSTIETMATRYIKAMRAVQAKGPYNIGGYCYGGIVAFEMARQLEEQGERVNLLAVFEGYALHRPAARQHLRSPRSLWRLVRNLPYWLIDYGPQSAATVIGYLSNKDAVAWSRLLMEEDRRDGLLTFTQFINDPFLPPAHKKVLEVHLRALRNYQPQTYGGHVTLFRVRALSLLRASDPEMGWGRFAGGGVKIKMIPGAHYNILEEPHVEGLAKQLGEVLQGAVGVP